MKIKPNELCTFDYDGSGVTLVNIKDCVEYVSLRTLAEMFNASKQGVLDVLASLRQSYSIRVIRWGEKNELKIHLADFRKALFDRNKNLTA